jgi:hypothetical protein
MQESNKAIAIALAIVAIAMAVYQLLYTQILIQSPDGHIITHLGFALAVTFLSLMLKARNKKNWWLGFVLLILSLAVTVYLMVELDDILEFRTSIPATSDLAVGTLIILILIVGNWLVFGKTFTIVSLVAVMYLIFGRFLPPPFTVPAISYQRLLMWLSVELGSGKGVYGSILDLSATYLFLFIFFGGGIRPFDRLKTSRRSGHGRPVQQRFSRHRYREYRGKHNHHRRLHHTDDEEERVYTGTSGGHRDGCIEWRSDYATYYGGYRLFDGRFCGYSLH